MKNITGPENRQGMIDLWVVVLAAVVAVAIVRLNAAAGIRNVQKAVSFYPAAIQTEERSALDTRAWIFLKDK